MKTHKPVVVITGEDFKYCRLCGVPVDQRIARNGRTVTTHADTTDRFPVLGGDLKPVQP